MNLLITGAHGQVGSELVSAARREGIPHAALGKSDLDITDSEAVQGIFEGKSGPPGMVVNLAAFTNVNSAEINPADAFRVNSDGVEILGRACAVHDIPMIHVSTDHVFPGGTQDFQETDPTNPLNEYGRSKVAGEEALRKVLSEHLILRTSWVFSSRGKNFVRTMLRLAQDMSEVRVVGDEIGCPTGAVQVAHAILGMAEHVRSSEFRAWGTYHFCGSPAVSRAGFARAIFAVTEQPEGRLVCRVREITSADHASVAKRPGRSVLDCSKVKRVLGIEQPDWRPYLQTVAGLWDRNSGPSP